MEANETEQLSPPLHRPKVGGLPSHFDKYKSLYSRNLITLILKKGSSLYGTTSKGALYLACTVHCIVYSAVYCTVYCVIYCRTPWIQSRDFLTFMRGRCKNHERFMSEKKSAAVKFMRVHERLVLGNLQHTNRHIHEWVAYKGLFNLVNSTWHS